MHIIIHLVVLSPEMYSAWSRRGGKDTYITYNGHTSYTWKISGLLKATTKTYPGVSLYRFKIFFSSFTKTHTCSMEAKLPHGVVGSSEGTNLLYVDSC